MRNRKQRLRYERALPRFGHRIHLRMQTPLGRQIAEHSPKARTRLSFRRHLSCESQLQSKRRLRTFGPWQIFLPMRRRIHGFVAAG